VSTDTDPYAELARDVQQTLITAGLTIANPDGLVTPNGMVPSGVGVDVADEGNNCERVVMLSWGRSDDAAFETVDIMLGAVAEVLRVHGFEVARHPVGRAYIVTGRTSQLASEETS
jgi:hypothetical protein